MDREKTNQAAMMAQIQEEGELTLQPFTMAIGQLLEEKNNPFANGKNFKPKMGDVNELMFVMCTDIDDLLNVSDEDWRKEVLRFAAKLTPEQIERIQAHCEREMERINASTTTGTPGKKGGAGRVR